MREITYLEAVREAMTQEMERDSRVFLIGEDIGEYGGAFQVTYGMLEKFGKERILDTPITELGSNRSRCRRSFNWHAADRRDHVYGFHNPGF